MPQPNIIQLKYTISKITSMYRFKSYTRLSFFFIIYPLLFKYLIFFNHIIFRAHTIRNCPSLLKMNFTLNWGFLTFYYIILKTKRHL